MKHKLMRLISLILIAAFVWQDLAWVQVQTQKGVHLSRMQKLVWLFFGIPKSRFEEKLHSGQVQNPKRRKDGKDVLRPVAAVEKGTWTLYQKDTTLSGELSAELAEKLVLETRRLCNPLGLVCVEHSILLLTKLLKLDIEAEIREKGSHFWVEERRADGYILDSFHEGAPEYKNGDKTYLIVKKGSPDAERFQGSERHDNNTRKAEEFAKNKAKFYEWIRKTIATSATGPIIVFNKGNNDYCFEAYDEAGEYIGRIAGDVRKPFDYEKALGFPEEDILSSDGGFYVREEYRDMGIGTALIEALAQKLLAENGPRYIRFSAGRKNRDAQRLYERLGFENKGVHVDIAEHYEYLGEVSVIIGRINALKSIKGKESAPTSQNAANRQLYSSILRPRAAGERVKKERENVKSKDLTPQGSSRG